MELADGRPEEDQRGDLWTRDRSREVGLRGEDAEGDGESGSAVATPEGTGKSRRILTVSD